FPSSDCLSPIDWELSIARSRSTLSMRVTRIFPPPPQSLLTPQLLGVMVTEVTFPHPNHAATISGSTPRHERIPTVSQEASAYDPQQNKPFRDRGRQRRWRSRNRSYAKLFFKNPSVLSHACFAASGLCTSLRSSLKNAWW